VRRDLVLDHVAKTQNLRATEAELDDRIADLAKRRDVGPSEVYTQLQKSGQLKELELRITEDKVWDYLMSQSTVTES
jgi:FKBP-type peptidyl-prolyl cis-trans isomerase (trigger factor)